MSSYSQRVANVLDDGERADSTFGNDSNIWMGKGLAEWEGCFRFVNVGINRGSTISKARITLETDGEGPESETVNLKLEIYGIDEGNTANFVSNPFGRDKTSASKTWQFDVSKNSGHTYTTVDLKTIVQEIVNRADWDNGHAIGFLFSESGSGGIGSFYSYDTSGDKCALLNITYTQAVTTSTTTSTSTSTSTSTTSSSTTSNSTTTLPIPASLVTGIMRVTKEGKDVIKSNFLDDFFLDSNYPLLKIHDYASFETGITGNVTINHALGYIPYVMVFSQYLSDDGLGGVTPSDEYYQHDWFLWGAAYYSTGYTKIYNDKIDINIGNINTPRPGVITGFYYIFKEEII